MSILNKIILNGVEYNIGGSGSGLTDDIKQALLQLASNVAYDDTDGTDYYQDLYDALYAFTAISLNTNSLSFATLNSTQQLTATTTPSGGNVTWLSSNTSVATVSSSGLVTSAGYGNATITASVGSVSATCSVVVAQATLVSISATYTQSGNVYEGDSLDSLKTDLVVTATWSNSTTTTVASEDYTLSGSLTAGTSTITVSYGGKTTTFAVTVTAVSVDAYPSFTDRTNTSGGYFLVKKSGATRTLLSMNGGTHPLDYSSDSTDTSLVLYPIPIGDSQSITITAPCNYGACILQYDETKIATAYTGWILQDTWTGWVASGTTIDTSDYSDGTYYISPLLYNNNVSIEDVTITRG